MKHLLHIGSLSLCNALAVIMTLLMGCEDVADPLLLVKRMIDGLILYDTDSLAERRVNQESRIRGDKGKDKETSIYVSLFMRYSL
jgi:hypothetical protein